MKETVEKGLVDLMIPGTDEYVQSLDKEVSAALVGQKTAKEALDSAANAWIEITAGPRA